MNFVDLILFTILIISMIISAKIGFVRTALGLLSVVISISLASYTYPVVADYIENSNLGLAIEEKVAESLSKKTETQDDESKNADTDENEGISFLPSTIRKTITDSADTAQKSIISSTAKAISSILINLISMVLVFIIVRILMFLLSLTLKFLTKLPIIKNLNCILGGALGIIYGVLIVYIILAVFAFNATFGSGKDLVKPIKESYIVSWMYDNNFIVNLVSTTDTSSVENDIPTQNPN